MRGAEIRARQDRARVAGDVGIGANGVNRDAIIRAADSRLQRQVFGRTPADVEIAADARGAVGLKWGSVPAMRGMR